MSSKNSNLEKTHLSVGIPSLESKTHLIISFHYPKEHLNIEDEMFEKYLFMAPIHNPIRLSHINVPENEEHVWLHSYKVVEKPIIINDQPIGVLHDTNAKCTSYWVNPTFVEPVKESYKLKERI